MAHDASPTWSGFNYQGKVGLFYALKLINEKLQSDGNFDFTLYELIYENHEDFDIKTDEGICSIHQVKAYNSTSYSKYINAVIEIILEVHTSDIDSMVGFLHTWKAVELPIAEVIKEFVTLKEEWENIDSRQESHIAKAVSDVAAGSIPKLAAIIRNKYKDYTEEEIIDSIDTLIENTESGAISNFRIYEYSQGVYCCELEAINEELNIQIQKYLEFKELPYDETVIERIFFSLLGSVDEHITSRHLIIKNPEKITLDFPSLINTIQADVGNASNAVLAFEFKHKIHTLLDDFIENEDLFEDEEHRKYFSDTENSFLEHCLEQFFLLPAKDLLDCYIELSPQLNICHDSNVIRSGINIEPQGIQNGLFYILSRLDSSFFKKEKNRLFYMKNGQYYLATSISNETPYSLAKNILSNPNLIESTFDFSTFIGGHGCQDIDNCIEVLNRNTRVSLQDFYDDLHTPDRETISKINGSLRVVSIQNIIGELND